MTIYWERCNLCGANRPVMECTLNPGLLVDIHCCVSCVRRGSCPKPVWAITVPAPKREALRAEERRKMLEELEALLKGEKG